jgi:hypothetical protein
MTPRKVTAAVSYTYQQLLLAQFSVLPSVSSN